MPRVPTYGEVAFRTYHSLDKPQLLNHLKMRFKAAQDQAESLDEPLGIVGTAFKETIQELERIQAKPADFEALGDTSQTHWENVAATVIAEFRKRQRDLSHQTPKDEVPF
jgi:hypothetical protein